MFNRAGKSGETSLIVDGKQRRAKKATLQSLVRKEKMRKYQNNYMVVTQKKQILNQKITPELCDRSISAKNSIEGGNSVESYICNAKNMLKAPLTVKQPKEIVIRIKKEEKGNITASENDTILINNNDYGL